MQLNFIQQINVKGCKHVYINKIVVLKMSEVFQQTMKCIQLMRPQQLKSDKKDKNTKNKNQGDADTFQFFEALLYGNWQIKYSSKLNHLNPQTRKQSQCTLYLNESHIQLLTCIDKKMTGLRTYFNLKKVQMFSIHPEYSIDDNLQDKSYLFLKENNEQFTLLFQNDSIRNSFKSKMIKLQEYLCKIPNMYDPLILKYFMKADDNQNQEISYEQLKKLMRFMKIPVETRIKTFMKKILKKQKIVKVNYADFQKLWKIFYCRQELSTIFQHYDGQKFTKQDDYLKSGMSVEQFKKFLRKGQLETQQDANRIISQMFIDGKQSISFYNFCQYILSQKNNLIDEKYLNYQIDTSKPLTHYYCYSSHNTYLTGNQLTSDSNAERYLVDLLSGIRCVEIDVHNSSKGPIVKHGFTLTSAVTFEEVIKSINKFTKICVNQNNRYNHTPIIISLENHCDEKNQKKMAEILLNQFHERILIVDVNAKNFPSLSQCMGKIIIKGPGNFKLFMKNYNQKGKYTVLEDQFEQQTQQQEQNLQDNKSYHLQQYKKRKQQFMNQLNQIKDNKKTFNAKKKVLQNLKSNPSNINQQLKLHQNTLKNILQSSKVHKYEAQCDLLSITTILSKSKIQDICFWESMSFDESKVLKFFNQEPQRIRTMSLNKWFRSYPGGLRFTSSNYDPLPAIQLGIHIIALNTQKTDDISNLFMKIFFLKGIKQCIGYQLKQNPNKSERSMKIQIIFISGLRIYQNDPQIDEIPPVKIDAYFTGTKRDNLANEKYLNKCSYTNSVFNNAFNPLFSISTPIELVCEDLAYAFLVVEVQNCGRTVLPLKCVKNGLRCISLYDQNYKLKASLILCKITVSKY